MGIMPVWTDYLAWEFWTLFAIALLIVEMLTFAYLALGFSFAAGIMALLILFGMEPGAWIWPLWAGTGALFWYLVSRWFTLRRRVVPDVNDFDSRSSLPTADREASDRWETPSQSYDTDTRRHEQKIRVKD